MTAPASKLLQPITVGPLELKNRIMFPPLTTVRPGFEQLGVAAMRETMQRTPGVVRVDDIKTRLFGSRTYVDAEIAVDGALPLRDAHVIAEAVHHELERDYPDVKHCTVHVNPA